MILRGKYKRHLRFNVFDFLWWQGEMLYRMRGRAGRLDGDMMLMMYVLAFVILPFELLCCMILPGLMALCAALCMLLTLFFGVKKLYIHRGRAVMKHYADRWFYPITGVLLFILPFVVFFVVLWLFVR